MDVLKAFEGRRELAHTTVYQKHRSVRSQNDAVYRLTPAQCWKVKGSGQPQGEATNPSPSEWRP
jgi:hypothetical protein